MGHENRLKIAERTLKNVDGKDKDYRSTNLPVIYLIIVLNLP